MDTMQQVESHLVMRHYESFIKKGRIKDVGNSLWPKRLGQEDRTMNLILLGPPGAGRGHKGIGSARDIIFQRSQREIFYDQQCVRGHR